MVAVKGGDIETLLRRGSSGAAVTLVYGPDAGLVNERAKILAEKAVGDSGDPFLLVKLNGDEVAADPLKLADEAHTIGLFGGRRAIWVKPTSRNLAPAVAPLLDTPPEDATIIIEAGDLAKSSPLRSLCERSQRALAVPCYADSAQDLVALIDQSMRDAGMTITRDARDTLLGLLGADRLASRNEIAKLLLYAAGEREITEDHVNAAVGDVSSLAVDALVDAAFLGELPELNRAINRLRAEGFDAGVALGFVLRHALLLAPARLVVDRGTQPAAAVEGMRGLHFKRKATVARQLRLWSTPALEKAVATCGQAIANTRKQANLAWASAETALWSLAATARRATKS